MSGAVHLDDEVLSAFVDGELTEVERRHAEDHQRVCDACGQRAAALRRVALLVGAGAPLDVAPPVAAPDLGQIISLRPVRRRARWVVAVVSAAAVVAAGVGISVAALGSPSTPPAPAASDSGLPTSLGSFASAKVLGPILQTEIASLAPGSGRTLPCHAKAAAIVGEAAGTPAGFSAPLTFAGAPAEVFAYRRPRSGSGSGSGTAEVAVVVWDRDCSKAARLGW
jgi:hypothetical protein